MRKAMWVSLLVVGLLLTGSLPSQAWHPSQAPHRHHRHGHVIIFGGPFWWWDPWYPYWWYPPPTYVYPPPSVIGDEPVEYIEQPRAEGYWYYCPPAKAYYPTVSTCPEAWVKVPPTSE